MVINTHRGRRTRTARARTTALEVLCAAVVILDTDPELTNREIDVDRLRRPTLKALRTITTTAQVPAE